MEHHKVSTLLKDSTVLKFVARKQIEVNDLSGAQYFVNKNISFKTPMLRSDLCEYSDVYILVKAKTNVTTAANTDIDRKMLYLKIMHHLDHT